MYSVDFTPITEEVQRMRLVVAETKNDFPDKIIYGFFDKETKQLNVRMAFFCPCTHCQTAKEILMRDLRRDLMALPERLRGDWWLNDADQQIREVMQRTCPHYANVLRRFYEQMLRGNLNLIPLAPH